MKQSLHILKRISLLVLGLFSTLATGQTVENFEYTSGELLTANGYGTKGDAPAVYVTDSGLEYSGLAVSGVGKAAHIEISENGDGDPSTYGGERIAWREMFSQSVSSGTVYLSFIAKIQSTIDGANMFNNFFISMSNPDRNKLRGRVMAKDDGSGNVMFGLTKGYSTTINWTTATYDYNKTYLFVVKYEFLTGGDSDDVASLFIFDAATDGVPTSEPTAADLTTNDGSDTPKIKIVHLRQRKVDAIVDGLIMGTSWGDVVVEDQTNSIYDVAKNQMNVHITHSDDGKLLTIDIDRGELLGKNMVAVYNIAGIKMISKEVVNQNTFTLDVNNALSKGVYILNIKGDKTNYSKKFLIK